MVRGKSSRQILDQLEKLDASLCVQLAGIKVLHNQMSGSRRRVKRLLGDYIEQQVLLPISMASAPLEMVKGVGTRGGVVALAVLDAVASYEHRAFTTNNIIRDLETNLSGRMVVKTTVQKYLNRLRRQGMIGKIHSGQDLGKWERLDSPFLEPLS